ncbi:MAG: DUF1847 domain-containing protein [Firmicutes bacterium]|nr:DUF1847 domain-containing protein [Bacillota bacterium]
MDENIKRSCIDCGNTNCSKMNSTFPPFCPTTDPENTKLIEEIKDLCLNEENQKYLVAAASVEYDYYCKLTRIEEIVEFAKRIGAAKLGIATCIGLINESRTLAKVLRHHGFEVYGIGCKVACIPKHEVGIPEECETLGVNTCNPIMQAKLLNKEKTDLNVVMGLCVGHDSLFYKYSEAPCTTAVAKDRVLCHNPAAALYAADFYYKKKLFP